MKTTIITIAMTLLFSVSVFASKAVVLTNEMMTENGISKEYITFFEDCSTPNKRVVQNFDNDGRLMERVTYEWDIFAGWIPATRIDYSYQREQIIAEVVYTKWDSKIKDWEKTSLATQYREFNDGTILVASMK